MSQPVVGFLGAGNMGSALIQGALRSKFLSPSRTLVYDLDSARVQALVGSCSVLEQKDAASCASQSDFLFLCVKPQQMQTVLKTVAPFLKASVCLVSIAAGLPTQIIENWMPEKTALVRVMPNTPAMLGCGISAICGGSFASAQHIEFALRFFSSVGKTVQLPQEQFDALTAVSGSGPAYVFYLAQNLIAAAQQMGIKEQDAQVLVKHTFLGAAQMLQAQDDAQTLRQKVTSPGGTTEAAIAHLQSRHWTEIFIEAVKKAKDRGAELSKTFGDTGAFQS